MKLVIELIKGKYELFEARLYENPEGKCIIDISLKEINKLRKIVTDYNLYQLKLANTFRSWQDED